MPRSRTTAKKPASRPRTKSAAALADINPAQVLEPLLWLLDALGVSRREVLATVRALPAATQPVQVNLIHGRLEQWSQILTRWAADPRFLGPDGRPRDLPFAVADPSFSDLVALELPGQEPAICRDTLLSIGAISTLPGGQLRWRQRTAVASGAIGGAIIVEEYLRPLRALLLVLQANLSRPAPRGFDGTFQRAVSGVGITPEEVPEFHSFVARHGNALLEAVDEWLVLRQRERQRSGRPDNVLVRPYMCLYLGVDNEKARTPRPARNVQRPKSGAKPRA